MSLEDKILIALVIIGLLIMNRQEFRIKQLKKEREAFYNAWMDELKRPR